MTTSRSDSPLLDGRGLAHVRERVRKAFEAVHTHLANELSVEPAADASSVHQATAQAAQPKPMRPLAQRAAPYLKAAERHLQHAPMHQSRLSVVQVVFVPTESAEELIAQALETLGGQ